MGRPAGAAAQFRKAAPLEPYYAEPTLYLGVALDEAGDTAGAADAYSQFLSKSVQSDSRRPSVEKRLQTLRTR